MPADADQEMTPCQPSADSSDSIESSDQPAAPTSKDPGTSGGLKARLRARLQKVMTVVEKEMRLPLDEHWYIRWDGGYNFDLVEVKMSDATHRLSDGISKPQHFVRSYCGANLEYALKLYATKAVAGSGARTAEQVLAALAKIDATIAKVGEAIRA